MTPTIDDYLALIPSANRRKPNFAAVIAATLQPLVDVQAALDSMTDKLDLDMATGIALDMCGEWVNLPRQLSGPITGVYFAFDTPGVGFDEGIWHNSSMPLTGLIELDDVTYRQMLEVKIAANHWDGSLDVANRALVDVFGSQGDPPVVWLEDNFNMTISFKVTAAPHSALLDQLVTGGYLPFRAHGVLDV